MGASCRAAPFRRYAGRDSRADAVYDSVGPERPFPGGPGKRKFLGCAADVTPADSSVKQVIPSIALEKYPGLASEITLAHSESFGITSRRPRVVTLAHLANGFISVAANYHLQQRRLSRCEPHAHHRGRSQRICGLC